MPPQSDFCGAFYAIVIPMTCWVSAELEIEWKRLVEQQVGAYTNGYDSPTVRLYWQMVEHRKTCEVCRDEEIVREMDRIVGEP